MMKLGEYLREKVGIKFHQPNLKALDVLSGQHLGYLQFEPGLDPEQPYNDSEVAHLSPFYFSVAYCNRLGKEVGFHLHPYYLDWEDLIVAHNDHNEVEDVATSLAAYVFRHLLELETVCCEEEEDPSEDETLMQGVNNGKCGIWRGVLSSRSFWPVEPKFCQLHPLYLTDTSIL